MQVAGEEDEFESETEDDTVEERRLTSREHQAEVAALSALGKALVELLPHKLNALNLDRELHDAVVECRPFRKSARIRQLRRITTLLRRGDVEALTAQLADVETRNTALIRRDKLTEKWRARLLEEGDAALTEFLTEYPTADRQRLRQLVRAAKREPGAGKSQQAARNLYQLVRASFGDSG